MNLSVLQQIPAKVRATTYLTLALIALVLGALQVGGVETLWGWAIVKALAVVGYLAAPFGITAAANVVTGPTAEPVDGGLNAGYDVPAAGDDQTP